MRKAWWRTGRSPGSGPVRVLRKELCCFVEKDLVKCGKCEWRSCAPPLKTEERSGGWEYLGGHGVAAPPNGSPTTTISSGCMLVVAGTLCNDSFGLVPRTFWASWNLVAWGVLIVLYRAVANFSLDHPATLVGL